MGCGRQKSQLEDTSCLQMRMMEKQKAWEAGQGSQTGQGQRSGEGRSQMGWQSCQKLQALGRAAGKELEERGGMGPGVSCWDMAWDRIW